MQRFAVPRQEKLVLAWQGFAKADESVTIVVEMRSDELP